MTIDEEKFDAFLENQAERSDTALSSFLKEETGANLEDATEAELQSYLTRTEPEGKPRRRQYRGLTKAIVGEDPPSGVRSMLNVMGEFTGAGNAVVLDLLGLPGDAFDWVSEKLGSDIRSGAGEDEIRALGQEMGISYGPGEIPETAATKAGQYTAIGLTFLAPMLRYGKESLAAVKMGEAVQPTVSTAKGVAQRITAPFITAPKTSFGTEITAGIMSGAGAYYGKKHYGPTGEVVGGLVGGLAALPTSALARYTGRKAGEKFFPYTKTGGEYRARGRVQELAETGDVARKIEREAKKILPGAKIPPAKLSEDRHLIALHNKIIESDPKLAHQFDMDEIAVAEAVRKELDSIGGDIPVAQTQAYLKGRIGHTVKLINARVDMALKNAKTKLDTLKTPAERRTINEVVYKQVDNALTEARAIETSAWNKVNQSSSSPTSNAKMVLEEQLLERAESADKTYIPDFIHTFLGKLKNGRLVGGKYGSVTTVKEMHTLRRRLNNVIRKEKAIEAPDWDKVRIMTNIQEAILRDLESSPDASNFTEALTVSRALNEKFKGGVMNTIFGHEKTGGRVAPAISLEGLRPGGPKAAVEIERILTASPESKGQMEDLLKLSFAQSNSITKGERVNVPMAKRWISRNEDTLEIFPELRKNIEHAIGLEERAIGTSVSAKARLTKIKGAAAIKIATIKPGRVMSEVMSSPNPQQAMKNTWRRSNKVGRQGLKNDVVDYLFGKSKTSKFDNNDMPILSGGKFASEWKQNKHIFKEALSPEEMKRMDVLANTMKLNEGLDKVPQISGVISPTRGPVAYWLVTMATRIGAKLGAGTSGASLRTASMGSKLMSRLLENFDVSRAQQVLKDAIQDPELFKALFVNTANRTQTKQAHKVLHGWMVAHAIESIEEK